MIWIVSQVAVGGAMGATLRYLVGAGIGRLLGEGFPLGAITANILGCFAMGVFVVFAANTSNTHLSPVIMTGFLGGFTTFSSFSLEAFKLFENGEPHIALLYVGLSVFLSISGLIVGVTIARAVFE